MPERRQLRVSEAQDGRSERPAMGYGQPAAGLGSAASRHLAAAIHTRSTCGTRSHATSSIAFHLR
jgi:hypothetical protein